MVKKFRFSTDQFMKKIAKMAELEFYIYAKVWPGTVCRANKKCRYDYLTDIQWNQHGIWPSTKKAQMAYKTSLKIKNCSKETLHHNKASNKLQEKIKNFWDGMNTSQYYFIKHEF